MYCVFTCTTRHHFYPFLVFAVVQWFNVFFFYLTLDSLLMVSSCSFQCVTSRVVCRQLVILPGREASVAKVPSNSNLDAIFWQSAGWIGTITSFTTPLCGLWHPLLLEKSHEVEISNTVGWKWAPPKRWIVNLVSTALIEICFPWSFVFCWTFYFSNAQGLRLLRCQFILARSRSPGHCGAGNVFLGA